MAVFRYTGKLGVFGLGYDDLSEALTGKLIWQTAALLLAAKFVATVACYGMGGCGGIFSPTLFFGAMTGLGIAGILQPVFGLSPEGVAMLTIVSMSATLGAVVRAPVTSILIVFEMTHQFSLVPPLMLAALVSQAISRRMARHNFYDALLEQDGHAVERFAPPRDLREWQKQPISHLANPKPIVVDSLELKQICKGCCKTILIRSFRWSWAGRFAACSRGRKPSGPSVKSVRRNWWRPRFAARNCHCAKWKCN